MAQFLPFQSSFLNSSTASPAEVCQLITHQEPSLIVVNHIVLNVKIRYIYDELDKFIAELQRPNDTMLIGDEKFSVFQLYTLHMLNEPVDMSNLTERKIYRPKLFVRKNDKFSSFNFNYLLHLFDMEYAMAKTEGNEFPKLWKTTFDTKVTVNIIKVNSNAVGRTPSVVNSDQNEGRSLLDILKIICREQKYDERHAIEWKANLEGKITSILQNRIIIVSLPS